MRTTAKETAAITGDIGAFFLTDAWLKSRARKRYLDIEMSVPNPERIKKSIIKRLYNITPEDLKVLHIKQRSKCAICGKSEKEVGTLVIDHCHNTGKVRGLLCRKHNAGIGLLGDNYKSVQNAANYLRRFDNKQ